MSNMDSEMLQLSQIADLEDSLSIKEQLSLVEKISEQPSGLLSLFEFLTDRRIQKKNKPSCIDGIIFKHLYNSEIIELKAKLKDNFQEGIVKLKSVNKIDYRPLYLSLTSNNFKTANQLTQAYLGELAGLSRSDKRRWLYFTDVLNFPKQDLETIDMLWKIYSGGQFGFSIQRQIWLCNDKNWEKFWHTVGWKVNKKNMRYPNEFIWDSSAPAGHLPLFNQLRGVQVLGTLFMHPVWISHRS